METMDALMNAFSSNPGVAIAGVLCGIALLYLVLSRTLKKRADDK